MNMRSTLMLMAATVVPAFAQQPALPATQELVQMAAPAQAPTATPEQRAAVFSSLALLPADLGDFITLADIAGTVTRFAGSGTVPDMAVEDVPSEILALDSVTFASVKANATSYKAVSCIMASLYTMEMTEGIARRWARMANEAAASVIRDSAVQSNANQLNAAVNAMPQVKFHPAYGVVTCKPGNEGLLQEWYAEAVREIQSEVGDEPGFEAVEINGFVGVKMELGKLIDPDEELPAEYLEYVKDDPDYLIGQAAKKEAAKRTLYVMLKQEGTALIGVVCEDPAEIKLAASPAESAVATDMVAEADANLNKGMIALVRYSNPLMRVNGMLSPENVNGVSDAVVNIFSALGEKDAANKAAYDKAGAGIKTVVSQLTPWLDQGSQPATMQCWCDEDLHFQFAYDARGMEFTPAPMRHADKLDAPTTIAYSSSSPYTGGPAAPSLPELMDAALDIAQGFHLTLPAEEKAGADQGMQRVKAVMPELKDLAAALATIGEGLDGNCAFVLDSAPGALPPLCGAQPGKTASVPRMALSFGVSDRSKLSTGWDGVLAAAGKMVAKFGGDPESVGMLPIVPAQKGEVTNYSVSLPFFNKGFIPTLAVSDSSLVAGTSMTLNDELTQTATGGTEFAGSVFMFRLAPLAATLGSLADALDEQPKDQGGAAVVVEAAPQPAVVAVEVEEDGDDYDEDYEEDYEDYEVVAPRSQQQRASDALREAAAGIKECAGVVEAIQTTITTENGKAVIRCDVKLK